MKVAIYLFVFLIISFFAIAESPPAIPMEIWGQATSDGSPVADGLGVKALVGGTDYAQATVTSGGYYDVILVNGDRPLTYNDDPTCATHWGAGEACVQCTPGVGPNFCIEGPQDGENMQIKIDNEATIPIVVWNQGNIVRQDLIVITGGMINYSMNLTPGWNLISIPILPVDSSIVSIMQGCSYNRIWQYDSGWTSTDGGLTSLDVVHGYWVDRVGMAGNCQITISGTVPASTTIDVDSGWTLVGYPSVAPGSISSMLGGISYNRVWEYTSGWSSTDGGLTTFKPGKGYWIDSSSTGSYQVN